MRSFNMGRFGGGDDPWFRVGSVDVTTTIFVVGMGVLSMFVRAIEGAGGPLLGSLVLLPDRVLNGQIWRLFTWPIPNAPSFWTIILFAFFFMLGSQLEAYMGRRLFTIYLVALTIVPAVIGTLFYLVTNAGGGAAGLRFLEIGVLVGFALRNPNARFMFGIPAWGLAGGVVVLDILQLSGLRQTFAIFFLLITVAVSLLLIRALGFAEEADWLPKLPLPVNFGGEYKAPQNKPPQQKPTARRKKRGRSHLRVAPEPSTLAPRPPLSPLQEAEMDAILDQVSERGMDSLTPQQRSRLEEHSKRLRKRD